MQTGLQGLIGAGVGALTSRFTAQDPEFVGPSQVPQITTGVQGGPPMTAAAGACCNGKPRVPDFLPYPGDPCYPRMTTRTVFNEAGCKVQIPVWAPPRKKPRMNVLNGRAARRAIRRVKGVRKVLQSIERQLPKRTVRATKGRR